MRQVKIHEAKTNLSRLLAEVEAGGEVIIARGDKPIAKLVSVPSSAREPRKPGSLRGKLGPNDGDEALKPLPEDIIELMVNGPLFPPD